MSNKKIVLLILIMVIFQFGIGVAIYDLELIGSEEAMKECAELRHNS